MTQNTQAPGLCEDDACSDYGSWGFTWAGESHRFCFAHKDQGAAWLASAKGEDLAVDPTAAEPQGRLL